MADALTVLGVSFLTMVIAEAGDKTQLALLVLASRHKVLPVLAGAILGFALLAVVAVALGGLLDRILPEEALRYGGGLLFIGYGLWMLYRLRRHDEEEEEEMPRRRSGFLSAFVLIAVLELGDKTQIAILGLSARFAMPLVVLLGSVLGFALLSLVAVTAGDWLRDRVGLRRIEYAGAIGFLVIGLLVLIL